MMVSCRLVRDYQLVQLLFVLYITEDEYHTDQSASLSFVIGRYDCIFDAVYWHACVLQDCSAQHR